MYDMKALYQATSVADAVALRLAHPEAQIIAGGSDVLVQMREGKRAGAFPWRRMGRCASAPSPASPTSPRTR